MTTFRQPSVLATSLLALGLLAGSVQAQTLITYFVDSINGSNANPGTSSQPFKTVNFALQTINDLGGPTASVDYQVTVKASSGPIAPRMFGGQESTGWLTTAEKNCQCCQRKPFPIRMQAGVDLVGEIGAGGRPVITIDEDPGHLFSAWTDTISQPTCQTTLQRAMVMAASGAQLVNFAIDGSQLQSSAPSSTGGIVIPGVYIGDVEDFWLVNCEVWDWHTEVKLEPGAGGALEAFIQDCDIHHAWPLVGNEGHAAIEYEGPGDAVVVMIDTTVRDSHDAVEPEPNGGTGKLTMTCTGCTFRDNENVFELGGPYELDITITDCDFIDNFPHGSPVTESNTIGIRDNLAPAFVKVRDSRFSNFSRAINWNADLFSVLDLGTDEDPGNNTFCLDFTAPHAQVALYRACIVQMSVVPHRAQYAIKAAGNWWLPNNQDAVGRELSIGPVLGPVNFPPPGPADCIDESTQQQWPRNFSISSPYGAIDFGTSSLSGSDPAPCTECTSP